MGHVLWSPVFLFLLISLLQVKGSTPVYNDIPGAVAIQSQDAYERLRELSKRESLIQVIFGRDCYSQALLQVDRDCNSITTEQKYKLAHAMNLCFLTNNGHQGYKCTTKMSYTECSKNLDDRAFTSYNTFYSNIHSLCLYISNREFERHTSQLLNKLNDGAGAAQEALQDVTQRLHAHQEQQRVLQQHMSQFRVEQSAMVQGLRDGLERLGSIQQQAVSIELQVNKTLAMEDELSRRQSLLMGQVSALEQMEQKHAALAEQQWHQVMSRAQQMEQRQLHYENLQEALASSSRQLMRQSNQLQGTVESVLVAQQKTSTLLGTILGSHWTLQDFAFYAASTSVLLLLTGPGNLQPCRMPVMALLFLTALGEKLLRQSLQTWLPSSDFAKGIASFTPSLSIMDQARWALRLLGCGVCSLLLLRRLIAKHRRELEDRRALRVIEERLDLLTAQQAVILKHIAGDHVAGSSMPGGVGHGLLAAYDAPVNKTQQITHRKTAHPVVHLLADSSAGGRAIQPFQVRHQPAISPVEHLIHTERPDSSDPTHVAAPRQTTKKSDTASAHQQQQVSGTTTSNNPATRKAIATPTTKSTTKSKRLEATSAEGKKAASSQHGKNGNTKRKRGSKSEVQEEENQEKPKSRRAR